MQTTPNTQGVPLGKYKYLTLGGASAAWVDLVHLAPNRGSCHLHSQPFPIDELDNSEVELNEGEFLQNHSNQNEENNKLNCSGRNISKNMLQHIGGLNVSKVSKVPGWPFNTEKQ